MLSFFVLFLFDEAKIYLREGPEQGCSVDGGVFPMNCGWKSVNLRRGFDRSKPGEGRIRLRLSFV